MGGTIRMKRSPLKRKTPLRTKKRINPVNRARRKKLYQEQFGDYAQKIRVMPCCVCGAEPGRSRYSHPHHTISRGAGGKRKDLVPFCSRHHFQYHHCGISSLAMRNINLVEIAARLWKIHGEDDITTQL